MDYNYKLEEPINTRDNICQPRRVSKFLASGLKLKYYSLKTNL